MKEFLRILQNRQTLSENQMLEAMTKIMDGNVSEIEIASFLTGLFGINLGGIPGAESPTAFWVFCGFLLVLATGLAVWLKHRRWW